MIRALIAIAVLFAVVLGLDALGTVPLTVAVEWPGGSMAPPARVVVVALVVFAILAVILWKIVSLILHGPGSVRGYFRGRRRDRGYSALSRGMVAIGSGDVRLAHRYSGQARKLLPNEPLVLLLEAQTAQLEGRSDGAREAFNRMLEQPDTRLLGLRGLFIEATRAGNLEAARHYANEAQRLSPGLPWAGTAVIENQSAEHDWAGALATLDQNAAAKLIEKGEARRLRAVLLTARAMEIEDAEPAAARSYALEAHRLEPDFVPAAVVAARVLTRLQDTRRAAKVIEAVWKRNPHPELADAYLHVRPGDSSHDRLKRARSLLAMKPNHLEGVLAVAGSALDAGEYDLARENLAKALRQSTTQRVCLMMADLEEAETGDPGRVREWLGRAVRADRDETWTADGVVSPVWLPISPVTGRLDAFEWRVPVATESGATELDGSDLAERAARPLEPPRPALGSFGGDEEPVRPTSPPTERPAPGNPPPPDLDREKPDDSDEPPTPPPPPPSATEPDRDTSKLRWPMRPTSATPGDGEHETRPEKPIAALTPAERLASGRDARRESGSPRSDHAATPVAATPDGTAGEEPRGADRRPGDPGLPAAGSTMAAATDAPAEMSPGIAPDRPAAQPAVGTVGELPAAPTPAQPRTAEDPMPFRPDDPGPRRDKPTSTTPKPPVAAFS